MYGFFFENYLEINVSKAFGYFDEAIALFFLFVIIRDILIKKKMRHGSTVVCQIIIIITAIISTAVNKYQPTVNAILDLFAIIKFPVTILGGLIFYDGFDFKYYSKYIARHLKILTFMLVVMTVLDMRYNLFPDTDYQFYKHGMKSLRLFYGHPATLSVVCLFLLSLLIVLEGYGIRTKVYQLALLIIMLLTLRAKIIGTLAIVGILCIVVFHFHRKITIKRLALLAPFALIFAWSEIQSYYIDNKQASRLLLTITSFRVAKDNFPFGSGLATFGSGFSVSPYSPVYSLYNLSSVWGLSIDAPQDISDTFWPMILGQLGVIALVAYVLFVYSIYKNMQKRALNRHAYVGCWVLLVYLLVASTSESAFVNAYGVFYAVLLALFMNTKICN